MTDFELRLCDAVLLAAQVREQQDDYFMKRTRDKLIAAKELEKKLDDTLGPLLAEARMRGWSADR
jgi:hypothetical protein